MGRRSEASIGIIGRQIMLFVGPPLAMVISSEPITSSNDADGGFVAHRAECRTVYWFTNAPYCDRLTGKNAKDRGARGRLSLRGVIW